MNTINFGLLKASLFNKLTESLDKDNNFNNSDCVVFFEMIKNDPFLQIENIVYKNILNKYIDSPTDDSTIRYIDENLNLFKDFNRNDYKNSHSKLEIFKNKIDENFKPSNFEILKSIDTLIFETLRFDNTNLPNVDALHEAYEKVLNHIKSPKQTKTDESKLDGLKISIRESILKSAINKFNEKYSHLNENDKNLLYVLVNPDNKAKQDLFESLKNDTYNKLQKSLESASQAVQERIKSSMKKIENMQFNEKNITKDMVQLHNLNKEGFSAK